MNMKKSRTTLVAYLILGLCFVWGPARAAVEKLSFEHNYTFAETVRYLNELVKAYPKLTELHTIGKSYLGKDLLVLEITSQDSGQGLEKPGFWIDGNLHASEVMGAAVCLRTIETLVTGYGSDASITELINTRTIYIMPKLNPDGSDHYLMRPDSMRSSVRPHDSDRDGLEDEDPGEDLNGDGYLTQMRIRTELGGMKTSRKIPD